MRIVFAGLALVAWANVAVADCLLPSGQPVPVAFDRSLNMPAKSQKSINNEWRIVVNPVRFNQYPMLMKKFIFRHECGHLYLNHQGMGNMKNEREADCWAMKTMQAEGLNQNGREAIIRFMENESPQHNSRAQALRQCQ